LEVVLELIIQMQKPRVDVAVVSMYQMIFYDNDFEFDMVDFEDYIEGEDKSNIEESVNKTIDMFKRFKKFN
jgi:hypothetical protein